MCVCARERVCVSFSGFPGEHKITQEGEEESQLMFFFYFGWLSFGEESSRILLCEKIVKLLTVNTCSCLFFFLLKSSDNSSPMSVKPDSAV